MKKIFYMLTIMAMVFVACEDGTNRTRVESTLGYSYTQDTIFNGHVYIFDNHGMMEHPDCPKCKENLLHTLDSLIDDRVVKLLGVELNEK